MTTVANLVQKISQLVADNRVIRPAEALRQARGLMITVSYLFSAYFNAGSTAIIDSLADYEVHYLKFIPMYDEGYLIILPAVKGEDGAVPLRRSASGNTGTVNMHGVLIGFHLDFAGKRSLRFPLITVQTEGEQPRTVALARIKKPARKARARRSRRQPAPPAGEP